MVLSTLVAALFFTPLSGQNPGHQKGNAYPPLSVSTCSASGCEQEQRQIVIDSNWMWLHKKGTSQNCYDGNLFDKNLCPDPKTCTANCALDAGSISDYQQTYGISTSGNALKLNFVTQGPYSRNVGSRTYLQESTGSYKMFKLLNKEFTFTVDVSNLPCGLNGALYFVAMDQDGGMSKYPTNKAGAAYGTGYCDAQCPHDLKFINGEANTINWNPSGSDKNSGTGKYGTCCTEMDIWESNSQSTQLTPHACQDPAVTQYRCSGIECGDISADQRYLGLCDKDGGDWNPYRLGNTTYFGSGSNFMVDTSRPFTVVTQFITHDNTDTGDLSEIRRFYVQDGKAINNTMKTINGKTYDSITDEFITAEKNLYNDTKSFMPRGGLKQMGKAFEKGMVLVMSLWDDHYDAMKWLDSSDPAGSTKPGDVRGPCSPDSGKPENVENQHPYSSVTYSDIKFGPLGSTTNAQPGPGPSPGGCPGGSLSACIGLCPSDPPAVFKACVQNCASRCPSDGTKVM